MKSKIKKIVTIIIFIILISVSYIKAAEGQSMKVSISSDKKSYQVGDEIFVDVNIDEIKGFSGINTFAAKKEYNSEHLEYIGATTVNSEWEVVGDATKVLLRKMEGDDLQKGKLCTLKFKALKAGKMEIKLSEVDACNNDGDVYYEDNNVNSPSIEINVKEANKSESSKSYVGIILIVAGTIGLVAISIHYIINKNKF